LPDCYKIKLRQVGYRLIYQVHDEKVSILVVAIGKRDKSEAYKDAGKRVLKPID
ncbi:type II toxin-antitoxin system RelE/ParE family toxin, partial [uncultured Pseudoalteromonas sp.]|uniref:type II toxin-antitoxin system RelE family toxin n=1 Tax=uncultured Pseudoalteromonas sp. TaxID=114053 RepID=UPI002594E2F6